MKSPLSFLILFSIFYFPFSRDAVAWGKRGHETVGSLAAQLLGTQTTQGAFLKEHSFDMGFYSNVPDIYWKREETYAKESNQHYIDMETFARAFEAKKVKSPWLSNRQEFFKKFPSIEAKEGRVFWRIQELDAKLADTAKKLKNKKLTQAERHTLQLQWLSIAGVIGHYVGDLAQPLHVTDNHDGQLSDQKGIHAWFESDLVDELFPAITNEVFLRAKGRWAEFNKKHKNSTAFDLSLELAKDSQLGIPEVLHLDKTFGRQSAAKVSPQYRELITERLTQGVLYLAQTWSNQLGWDYDGKKFYGFSLTPEYIEPQADKK